MEKKNRGRAPSLDLAGQRRAILKNLRFSEAEWKLVQERMAEAKIQEFSEYARLACLQISPIVLDAVAQKDMADLKKKIEVLLARLS